MPQHTHFHRKNRLFSYSFTTGVKLVEAPRLKTENDVLSHALWLVNHGKDEEAERFLDRYCSQSRSSDRGV
ncbi:MAG: hypothetical protein KBE09_01405 [Candidatus Pacebacteria bacterium]|nr:hypothetical protein [Candidatus Paceibacterota bacterium]